MSDSSGLISDVVRETNGHVTLIFGLLSSRTLIPLLVDSLKSRLSFNWELSILSKY